ncbi:MAG: DUF481 domain-containing protein [Acidobacteria bacterium]|nr:DUF481 domain-containing protein [Acidobacteriota bacterium]
MCLRLPLFLLLFFAALSADTVTVDSGDELHGEVVKIEGGKLFLKTGYAGTIQIDWTKVTDLKTASAYTVEVETGRRYTGAVSRQGDQLAVQVEDVQVTVETPRVVSVTRADANAEPPGFWKTLKGSIGVGYSLTRGNSRQTTSSLASEGTYRSEAYALHGDLNSIFSRQQDSQSTSRHALNGRIDRYLGERAFAFGLTGFERNDRQKLDLRSRFGGGFGWKIKQRPKVQFDLLGGFTATNEQFRADDGERLPRNTTGEGLFGFEWKSTQFRGMTLTTRLTAHPNVVQKGRYRIEYDSSVRIPLISGLTWSWSLFDRYDSQPPREDVLHNDYGLVSNFGFAF